MSFFFYFLFFNISVCLHPLGGFPCVIFLHPYKCLVRLNYLHLSGEKAEAPIG